jgi:hypothetical protein
VRGTNGHFEEFCDANDANELLAIVHRAKAGTLAGHVPKQGERYAARVYFYKNRILVKLTSRKIKSIRR